MFQQEIESYLGIPYRAAEAKTKLETTRQDKGEDVSSLFVRLNKLWHYASIPTDERVRQFRRALQVPLQYALSSLKNSDITDERDLLDRARSIEHNRNSARVAHPQSQFPSRSGCDQYRRQQQTTSSFQKKSSYSQPALQANVNTFTAPLCAVKPASWQGPWYEPQFNPPKLTSEAERIQLHREGLCYRYRGSGHQATHPVCPIRAARSVNLNTTATSSTNDTTAEAPVSAPAEQEN
ncbi:hypothetical protein KEM55_005379 [Ascosphaera atra]|nr:hypothetical protein KEM55_005379 [Ascosphaera atra]